MRIMVVFAGHNFASKGRRYFVLYNWDSTKLGDALVSAASNELLTDSIKNLKKSIIDPTTYTCTAEANYSFNQGRGNLHGVGDRVNLYNKGYDDSYRSSRVIGYEFSLDIPLMVRSIMLEKSLRIPASMQWSQR